MKRIINLVIYSAIIIGSSNICIAASFKQNCHGYLVKDEFGLHLAKNSNGAPFDGVSWCDASIEDQDKVLRKCVVGGPCSIKGSVQGHGVFNWVKIDTVN